MSMDKKFWKATEERVISSVAGGVLGALGAGSIGVLDVDWKNVVSVGVGAGIVSLLKALVAANVNGDGPSLTGAETPTPAVAPLPDSKS